MKFFGMAEKPYDNYKDSQINAAVNWLIEAIDQDIPRLKKILEVTEDDNYDIELVCQLEKQFFNYGASNVTHLLTTEQRALLKKDLFDAVDSVCKYGMTENMYNYVHFSCSPTGGNPEFRKKLQTAFKEFGLSEDNFVKLGCYIKNDGSVNAYVGSQSKCLVLENNLHRTSQPGN